MQVSATRRTVAQITCNRLQLSQPSVRPMRLVSVKSGNLEIPDAFKQALQSALQRNEDAIDSGSSGGYSSSSGSSSRAAPRPEVGRAAAESPPLLQILATALGQSRATLERLQAEEAEIENLIQKERKQVERMEWLLEKVQMDYAYFNQLQKRFDQEHGSASNRW
eukprot:GHUV01003247.1.p1 GENE.GHUV01003247.1~~GHUV01003247.1.p1  ORF type:complete len:165 (+),score=54.41 GHUV01003247.1:240-734(+)